MPDPYDPIANKPIRYSGFQDVSFYKGKFYLYFGATPAIFLHLPFFFIAQRYMPDSLAVLIFIYGSLIWSTLLLNHLKNLYFENLPNWIINTCILVLGFSNLAPFMLSQDRPHFYVIAISAGCFFLTGAIYWLSKGIINDSININNLALGSLFLGLCIGCRPHFFFTGIILLTIVFFFLKKRRLNFHFKNMFLALIVPFLFCLILQLLYNYYRFDNITEFGVKYQLTMINGNANIANTTQTLQKVQFVLASDISPILSSAYSYLFQPPVFSPYFPYIRLRKIVTDISISRNFPQRIIEKIAGLFTTTPFMLVGLLSPLVYLISNKDKQPFVIPIRFPFYEFLLIMAAGLFNFYFLLPTAYRTMRFMADFTSLFILAVCIIWFYFDSRLIEESIYKKSLKGFAVISSIISILFGIGISLQ